MNRFLLLMALLLIGYWTVGAYASTQVSGKPSDSAPAPPRPEPTKAEQLKSIIESDNAPIQFYGIVLDETGAPLPDVEVSWRVLKAGSFAPSLGLPTRAAGTVRTDAKGNFAINETGSSISFESFAKPGYRPARQMRASYGYGSNAAPHQPDEAKPVNFLMVKDDSTAAITVNVPLKFDWDGSAKEFEIGTTTFSEKVMIIPTREAQKPGERGYNWKLVLKVKNGQLVLGKNGDAPLAPDSGYSDEIIFQQTAGPKWWSNVDALIYLKTNSGKFAELRITAYSDRGMGSSITGRLSVRWNPTGGRSFE